MWVFLRELTACNGVLSFNDLFREVRVFKSPETQKSLSQCLCAVDIIFSITDCDKIWVGHVDINATYLTARCYVKGKFEKRLKRDVISGGTYSV